MGYTLRAHAHAALAAYDHHAQAAVGHIHAHLLKATLAGEGGKGEGNGLFPCARQTGGYADHVLLRNAAFHQAVLARFRALKPAGTCGVCYKKHHILPA